MSTRRTTTGGLLAGLVALTTAASAQPARGVGTEPGLRIAARASITIDGHGYGHGHGLSQYGAEGAARQGLSARQIVRFYYPTTTAGTAKGPVRVLITADTDDATTVLARSGLAVRDLATGSVTRVPTTGPAGKATRWRLAGGSGGATKVSYRTDAWHPWKRLDGDGEFRAAGPLRLVLPSQNLTYRGTLQSRTPVGAKASHRVTVNRVPLDAYVQGVIPREMPALWHQPALRAQAIAARTYAAYEEAHSTNPVWQLCDTTSCQVYGGKSGEYPSTNRATAKTAHQVRLSGGQPAFTQFSASSGGWTSDGGKPYLPARKDPYDAWPGNAVHSWSTTVTPAAIEKAWPAVGNLSTISVDKRDGNGQWNGRVQAMTLHGSNADLSITGDEFRSRLGLRSTWFTLST